MLIPKWHLTFNRHSKNVETLHDLNNFSVRTSLVGGFNPSEKHLSNWKSAKPPPGILFPSQTSPSLHDITLTGFFGSAVTSTRSQLFKSGKVRRPYPPLETLRTRVDTPGGRFSKSWPRKLGVKKWWDWWSGNPERQNRSGSGKSLGLGHI